MVMVAAGGLALTGCARLEFDRAAPAKLGALPVRPPYPTVGDYNTLRSARFQVRQALFERDWRRQHSEAYFGLLVMVTMHPLAPGPCRDFVAHTYDELLSLHDNYRGEDWAPLKAMVRRDPPVTICRAPPRQRVSTSA